MSLAELSDKGDYTPGKKIKVLVVAGPSGGHIFPAQALIVELKDSAFFAEPLLVLPKKNALSSQDCLCRAVYLSATSIKPKLNIGFLSGLFNFAKAWAESLFIIADFRPDVVVGFGSSVSIPVIIWAWIFRIKTLVHEQNVIPGRANKFLVHFVDRFAGSFPQTKDYIRNFLDKFILTGNPIRQGLVVSSKEQARKSLGLGPDKFVILVTGGSQGSHRVNRYFLDALALASRKNFVEVLHLCGKLDKDMLMSGYKKLNVDAVVMEFCNSMQHAYSAADLVVSRSGATTISELIKFRIPAILVPYPFAYQHQVANATVLKQVGAADVVLDGDLDRGVLASALNTILNNPGKIKNMRLAYEAFPVYDAARQIMDSVLSLCKG